MYAMVYNAIIDLTRKNQMKNKLLNELKATALQRVILEKEVQEHKKVEFLKKQIEKLPKRCKEILIMNKRDGKKYKEIAKELNIFVKTVESQMRVAFKKIRDGFNNDKLLLFVLAVVYPKD